MSFFSRLSHSLSCSASSLSLSLSLSFSLSLSLSTFLPHSLHSSAPQRPPPSSLDLLTHDGTSAPGGPLHTDYWEYRELYQSWTSLVPETERICHDRSANQVVAVATGETVSHPYRHSTQRLGAEDFQNYFHNDIIFHYRISLIRLHPMWKRSVKKITLIQYLNDKSVVKSLHIL